MEHENMTLQELELHRDDSLESLLKDLKGYIEDDRHERIMRAFYQQHDEPGETT